MRSKSQSKVEQRSPNHFNASVEAPAPCPSPLLAEGTRKDIHIQTAKGLRIATRCETVEKFIAVYHPICEDTAIFIPNTRRSIGAITQFTFNLADGQPALVGIGSVVEEFTTNENRFGQVGIVIALQQLARGSKAVFEKLVAARAAREELAVDRTPGPLYARTVTGPVTVPDAVKADARLTEAAKVAIPNPGPHRAKTVMGIPAISKPPAVAAFKVPAIVAPPIKKPEAPRRASAKQAARIEAAPAPQAATANDADVCVEQSLDAIPTAIPAASDTIRDVAPYALHHTLGNAPAVVTAVTTADESGIVTSVSMVDDPSLAAALETAADPAVIATADVFESVTSVGTNDEILVFRAFGDAAMAAPPVAMIDPAPSELEAEHVPEEPAEPEAAGVPDELEAPPLDPPPAISTPMPHAPSPSEIEQAVVAAAPSSRPWRWAAAFATLLMLLVATAAVTVLVDEPSVSPQPQQREVPKQDSTLKVALMAASEPAEPVPAVRPEAAEPPPAAQPVAAPPAPAAQPVATKPAAAKASSRPTRIVKAPAPKVRPKPRPVRRVISRKKCSSLDCL